MLNGVLSQFRWWRRQQGGHWEFWLVGPMGEHQLWFRVPVCSKVSGRRPDPGCKGTPACEDWPVVAG